MTLRLAQAAWAERLLADPSLCDAVAVVGPGERRVPVLRALLANVSEPLRTAFYGDFREGRTKEIRLPDVPPAAFERLWRAAAGLDPGLTPESVVATRQAAQMYMINELVEECDAYLARRLPAEGVLTVLTDCLASGHELPEKVEREYWRTILVKSEAVVQSPAFARAHASIVLRLLKLDELGVPEEVLWSRLVDWAARDGVLEEVESLATSARPCKRRRACEESPVAADVGSQGGDDAAQPEAPPDAQTTVLRAVARHIRFPAMDKAFFADNARQYLSKEDSESILLWHLLGRPTHFQSARRLGPSLTEQPLPISVTASHHAEQAERLPGPFGGALWRVTALNQHLDVSIPDTAEEMLVTRISFTLGDGLPWFSLGFSCETEGGSVDMRGALGILGRSLTWRTGAAVPSRRWRMVLREHQVAPLRRVEFFGTRTREALAADVVDRLAVELLLPRQEPAPPSSPTAQRAAHAGSH